MASLTLSTLAVLSTIAHAGESAPASEVESQFTALDDAIAYPTENCNGAVVVAPKPGTQFLDPIDTTSNQEAIGLFRKAAQRNVTWLTEMSCSRTNLTHAFRPPAESGSRSVETRNAAQVNSTYYSSNWAGYQIGNNTLTGEYVQGGWQIPTVSPVGPPTYSTIGYSSSTWVGRGGGVGSLLPLVQAGSTQHMSASNVADYYLWYEVYGNGPYVIGETRINNLRAVPGDDLGVFVRWHPNLGQSQMAICNFSVNTCVDFFVTTPEPGKSMEWIVEAPSPGLGTYPIANYNYVRFYSACWVPVYDAKNAQCQPITGSGVTSPWTIYMRKSYFGALQLVSYPQSITSNGLYVYYQHPENLN